MNAPDPGDLQATVQAALGARCAVGIDFVDIDERTYNMDPEKLREYRRMIVDLRSGNA